MAYDPNPNSNRPDLNRVPEPRRSSSWMGWVAILAVIVVGAFVWSQMGGSTTDPATTSSTTPAVTTPAPAPAPATPAAPSTPSTNNTAPANGGSQPSQP